MTSQKQNRESETSERRLTAADKQRQALRLRRAGATYERIAEQVGYRNASGALKAVRAGLKATLQEPADDLRALELGRYDAMLLAIWQQVEKGNLYAIDRALKVLKQRAELLGLNSTTIKVQQVIGDEEARVLGERYGLDPAEVIAEAEAILAQARND